MKIKTWVGSMSFCLLFGIASCELFMQDPVEPRRPEGECAVARDCGAGFECRRILGVPKCVRQYCSEDTHCAPHESCFERFGLCFEACQSDTCAPGQHCLYRNGRPKCAADEELPRADHCLLSPQRLVVQGGTVAKISGSIFDLEDSVLPYPQLTFTGPLLPDIEVGVQGDVVVGPVTRERDFFIEAAHLDQTVCSASVKLLPPIADNTLRVATIDAYTGASIPQATVIVRVQTSRREIREITLAEGDSGVYTTPIPEFNEVLDLSVYASGYDFLTVVTPTESSLILALVPALPQDEIGGVVVEPDRNSLYGFGDGIAGFSWLSPTALSEGYGLHALISFEKGIPVDFLGMGEETLLNIGQAAFFDLGISGIKTRATPRSQPGTRQLGFLLMKQPLQDFLVSETAMTVPLSMRAGVMTHGIVDSVEVVSQPRLHNLPTEDYLTDHYDVHPSTPTLFTAHFAVQQLPWGSFLDLRPNAAVVVTGVYVAGRGYSPLGFGRALDNFAQLDGTVESKPSTPDIEPIDDGQIRVPFAPPHDGLEGYPWRTVVTAADALVREQESGNTESMVFLNGPPPQQEAVAVDSFLDFSQAFYLGFNRTLVIEPAAEASAIRLRFRCRDREWQVLLPPLQRTYPLPVPPDLQADCIDTAQVETLRLDHGATVHTLVRDGKNAGVLLDQVLMALSRQPATIVE